MVQFCVCKRHCPIELLGCCRLADYDPQAHTEVEGQAWVANGGDVLVVGQVFSLAVNGEARQKLEAAAEIDFGVAVIEIAIG